MIFTQKFKYYPHLIKFFSAAAIFGIMNYIPIFAKSLGISDANIGVIASLFAAALFISTYVFGRLADSIGRRPLIIAGLLLSSVSFLLYVYAKDFESLLAIRILSGIGFSIQTAALVAYAHDVGHRLGKLTAFEALGIAFGSILIGIITLYFDIISIFLLSAVFFFIAFMISLKLERINFKRISIPIFPYHILKKNLPIYISFFIRHAAANSIWVFWGLYILQLGGNLFWVGMTMAINTLTQFFVMLTVTDRMKVNTLIALGTLLSAVTFFLFGISIELWQLLLSQIVLGISWAFLYVGSIRWITDNTKEKATGLGLLNSFINLSMLIGPLIATAVVQFGGYRSIMFVAAAMAFSSFLVFDVLSKNR
ncbi:MAG: MFS transporter [Candidatus Aenigmarchaeota archaeon]|nr:MFS transporter [Candidatus Aenigmarchaeota archaeon]